MRNRFFIALSALFLLVFSPSAKAENTYLEKDGHYTARSAGNGVIHFYIPIWVYGAVHDYYLYANLGDGGNPGNDDSYIWFSTSKNPGRGGSLTKAISFRAVSHGKNNVWDTSKPGEGYIRVNPGCGTVVLKSCFDGVERQIKENTSWGNTFELKRKDDDGHKHITYLEFDWYPPAALDDQTFYVGVNANIYRKWAKDEGEGGEACDNCGGDSHHIHWIPLDGEYKGGKGLQSPELFDPYLFTLNENGVAGYGKAAIPFVSYQKPIKYITSFSAAGDSTICNNNQQSGTIYLDTKDEKQENFYATFRVWRDETLHESQVLSTNKITIPAYHRIYDFTATELRDAQNSVTGQAELSWTIKNPNVEDLVDGDFFEIQRGIKSDFSDATSISLVAFDQDSATYHYLDDITTLKSESDTGKYVAFSKYYDVYDGERKIARFKGTVTSGRWESGIPVYYRVRRASASVWGWEGHDFVRSASLIKNEFLAPLARTQEPYTKDEHFDENRIVHFNLKIENEIAKPEPTPKEECTYDIALDQSYYEVPVEIEDKTSIHELYFNYKPAESANWAFSEDKKYVSDNGWFKLTVPYNATVRVASPASQWGISQNITATGAITGTFLEQWNMDLSAMLYGLDLHSEQLSYEQILEQIKENFINDSLEQVKTDLYANLLPLLQIDGTDTISRCQWDKNAQVIITKRHVELGTVQEIYVPQDSIVRQADGSWLVHATDVADAACTHYEYSARIDPSHSVLNFNDSYHLHPVPISGPDLYTAEVAEISSFTATQGSEKQGVLLSWEPTPGGVTDYVLSRRDAGTNADFEDILETEDAGYRDMNTIPGKNYDYQLTIRYTCNGNSSEHNATTVGWRSLYGSIRGRIMFEDGSGCAGITVTAEDTLHNKKSVITGEDGSYLIDSLLYDGTNNTGTTYTITPTAEHGQFFYNHTSAQLASINISSERCEATNIDFENTECVRVTGRVLYHNTTIPVYGAHFKLNGKLVHYAGDVLSTDHEGKFQMRVPKGPITLQVVMDGHSFLGDGFLRINGKDTITLEDAQDGVRFWDMTTVRLVGRIVGGNDQGKKPLGFGLSTNNLGDNLKMAMELEGDNISYMIRYPSDPTITERDTTFIHYVQNTDGQDSIGITAVNITQKRLTINPDPNTGEFEVDLWPVRYKIVLLTAQGYATLYGPGQGMETLDLTTAVTNLTEDVYNGDTVRYNAIYKRIYHAPVQLQITQRHYGVDIKYYGEKEMDVSSVINKQTGKLQIVNLNDEENPQYLFGYPVFKQNEYQFRAEAFEEYFYNNDKVTGTRDRVYMHGGTLRVHNGLHSNNQTIIQQLDDAGKANFSLTVDDPEFLVTGESALRTVTVSAEIENDFIEAEPLLAFVTGNRIEQNSIRSEKGDITILDVLRDPPGENSYAWLESDATYNYAYTFNYDVKLGVEFDLGWGSSINNNIGSWTGVGAGIYTGTDYAVSKQFNISIPLTWSFKGSQAQAYTFKTNSRITTSSDNLIVGSDADVFLGVSQSVLFGQARAIRIIDEDTYNLRQPAVQAGTLKVLGSGINADGTKYYLVIGTETVIGSKVSDAFVYTQHHIINTLLPQLVRERNSLLLASDDSLTVQKLADKYQKILYWSHPSAPDSLGLSNHYTRIFPGGIEIASVDQVAVLNDIIAKWVQVLAKNEQEKVEARNPNGGRHVGTYSVSGGTSQTYSETFEYSNHKTVENIGFGFGGSSSGWTDLFEGLGDVSNNIRQILRKKNRDGSADNPWALDGHGPGTQFSFDFKPIVDVNMSFPKQDNEDHSKSVGFTLVPSKFGSLTVDVYSVKDTTFVKEINSHTGNVDVPNSIAKKECGNFVFFTEAGASMCPHENEEYTRFYNISGTYQLLNNGTLKIEDPRMQIDAHERSDVPADKPAIFNLRLSNEGQVETGLGAIGTTFELTQTAGSNPNGAKIYIDGLPVTGNGMEFFLGSGESVNKVMEVYRGIADDYEDIELRLGSSTCASNADYLKFSVHFLPTSSDVEISAPHDKWIMNTFSAQDSVGYYIPVTIEGFDIHHRGFDHIEFQYKLATQSDDAWVNQCSFYADQDLYNAATGNKQMITNGRINSLRFYGERDPMEQQYDLRAVTFCRHGSGFVSKSSKVLTGIKDTRPPRVFGMPEPANSILGVGNNLKLRFNEPIAGNYLDEDNNFQLLGTTNGTGITSSTSIYFDGSQDSYAVTKTDRNLSGKSFTIDMLVKPSSPSDEAVFFTHDVQGKGFVFGKDAKNRLCMQIGNSVPRFSQALEDPMTTFTRVIVTYDHESGKIRFYAGTKDVTDESGNVSSGQTYSVNAPLYFGRGFAGNILEARVWTKALTQEEIAATHLVRLTGYEHKLMAYYPMNEGKGNTLTDKANGATLYLNGASWTTPNGISLQYTGTQTVTLDQDVLSRAKSQDYTLMFWFKTTSTDATLFSAGWTEPTGDKQASGTWIGLKDGDLTLRNNALVFNAGGQFADDSWHHFVITVNRTMNAATIFVDGLLRNEFTADPLSPLSGIMHLGEQGFIGHMDEFVLYEQAMPKPLIERFDNVAPHGDEMGLVAYLPFEERKENTSGVMENIFTINNRRIVKDSEGNVINKIQPLVIQTPGVESMADRTNDAPVGDKGALTKLNFDWAFNHDELLINLNMLDREINKQTIYVTVSNVEDLNGNRMVSPVMWQAFVDRNSLKWSKTSLTHNHEYGDVTSDNYEELEFINNSGQRLQYSIDQLPSWISVDQTSGTVGPTEVVNVRFTYNSDIAPGIYTDLVYLTDENGLSEPLQLTYSVIAKEPYTDIDDNKYTYNMSICGRVIIAEGQHQIYDSDPNDIVYALYHNECVGMAHITYNNLSNTAELYMTVYGSDEMNRQVIRFQLWQASTGKVYNLIANRNVLFSNGFVYGCGDEEPLVLTTSGSEMQNILLKKGWNWISTNLDLTSSQGVLATCMTAADPWKEGDVIKNPYTREYSNYDAQADSFSGSLTDLHFSQMYMVYCANGNTVRIAGDNLPEDSMKITFRGDNQWSALPCLFDQTTALREALTGYLDKAKPGDLIKSHNRFATFSTDARWVGDLTAMNPGEGYLFRRVGPGTVEVPFYKQNASTTPAPKRLNNNATAGFTNEKASSNMTMIAVVEGKDGKIETFINDEKTGEAKSIEVDGQMLYFITIQSDKTGIIRFEMNGETLEPVDLTSITYIANSHHGSLKAPVVLRPTNNKPYKIIENNHVIIIRNNEKYDITGKKL